MVGSIKRNIYSDAFCQTAYHFRFSLTYKSHQLRILNFVLTGDPLYMD